jgi:hypothetical protein
MTNSTKLNLRGEIEDQAPDAGSGEAPMTQDWWTD